MKRLAALTIVTTLLASCSSTPGEQPTVIVQPGSQNVTTFAMDLRTTTRHTAGPGTLTREPIQSPAARVAYRFTTAGIQMRADIDGKHFEDQAGRMLLLDTATGKARILNKSTMKPDTLITPDMTRQMTQNFIKAADMMLLDPSRPFQRLSTDSFQALAGRLQFDKAGQDGTRVTYRRVNTQGDTTTTTRLTFDTAAGQVTSTATETLTPILKVTSDTTLSYLDVNELPGTALPHTMQATISSTTRGAAAKQPVPYPEVKEYPEGTDPASVVPAGMVEVSSMRAPKGVSGLTDINTNTVQVTTTYENLAVNTLSPDYFQGGNQ